MDEERTFNKLRQTPVEEMLVLLDRIPRPAPLFAFNDNMFNRSEFFPEITFYLERVALLKEHGWTVEEFYLALEKSAIMALVKKYNETTQFPQEFLERAKRSFPNLKFTPAKLELE
jgi:hypothetical protein